MNNDYKELYELYKAEADVYVLFYQEEEEYAKHLLIFCGVIASMLNDSLDYEIKHGDTQRLRPIKDRIKALRLVYNKLSGLHEKNIQLRAIGHSKTIQINQLIKENEELKKQLSAVEKAFKAE